MQWKQRVGSGLTPEEVLTYANVKTLMTCQI